MAFCPKCGKEIAEGDKFCTSCGASLSEAAKTEEVKAEEAKPESAAADKVKEILDTPDTTEQYDEKDIADNRGLALLAYIGLLWLVPLLAAPKSAFARYHVNQGLVLWIANLILSAGGFVLCLIPVFGVLVLSALSLIILVLRIIGIVNAVQCRAKELPIIGKYTILK